MMDNRKSINRNLELTDIIWDILTQWKALLIVSLVVALIISGLKYSNDMKSYNAAKSAENKQEEIITGDPEQQIQDVLAGLPQSDRVLVMQAIKQGQWIEDKNSYIEDSLFMKMNPYDIRILKLGYHIEGVSDPFETATLISGYESFADEDALNSLADVISPGAQANTIRELISTSTSRKSENSTNNGGKGPYFQISVFLPDDVDAKSVENELNGIIDSKNRELSQTVPHTVSLYYSEEARCVDDGAIERQVTALSNGYSVQTWQKGMTDSFTDQQKTAFNLITALLDSEKTGAVEQIDAAAGEETIVKPGFSKKYLILGLVFGALVYIAGYGMLLLIRNRINSASDASYYGGTRLLGEIYLPEECKGIKCLMKSSFISRLRYGKKTDVEKQMDKLISTSKAVLEHNGVETFTLADLTDNAKEEAIIKIVNKFNSAGITVQPITIEKEFDESRLLGIKNIIIAVSRKTDISMLTQLTELCSCYDIRHWGMIFIDSI